MRSTAPRPLHDRPATVLRLALVLATLALVACGAQVSGPGDPPPRGEYRLVEGHGPDGEIPLVEDAPVTLTVDDEDWGGTAACNQYGGTVTLDGDRLEVREVLQTEMACANGTVMRSERAYLDAFMTVDRFAHDGDRLVLHGDEVELVFEPVTE